MSLVDCDWDDLGLASGRALNLDVDMLVPSITTKKHMRLIVLSPDSKTAQDAKMSMRFGDLHSW